MTGQELDALEGKLTRHLKLAVLPLVSLVALAAFNVGHWFIWLPGLASTVGLVVSLAMQLNRIDELRGDVDTLN